MENNKIVYGSTSDFLKYINARTKEKSKNYHNRNGRSLPPYSNEKKVIDTNGPSIA
jgi:hypothetical protein